MSHAMLRRLAVVQMCAGSDPTANFSRIADFVHQASSQGCSIVCLPENFDFIATSPEESVALAQPLDGPLFSAYQSLARQHGVWLSLGGFHEKVYGAISDPSSSSSVLPHYSHPSAQGIMASCTSSISATVPLTVPNEKSNIPASDSAKLYNTHAIVDNMGRLVTKYHKTHLFDVDVPGYRKMMESATTSAGKRMVAVKNTPIGCLGLSVCYDLRFPTLYSLLRFRAGCDVVLVPSAFMPTTGEAHWETLLRARAIETQCYVVAAAQAGQHNPSRRSYGHSMVIDPWGTVVGKLDGDSEGILVVDICEQNIASVRARMPIESHLRWDLYGDASNVLEREALTIVDAMAD